MPSNRLVMPTVAQQVRGLAQLFRVKPVLSWGVSAFILGAAVAVHGVGWNINYVHGALAITLVLLSQGVVSHGLNDAYDWLTGTDKESIGKGTGGSRVIPEGKMTVAGTIVAAVAGLVGVIAIGAYFVLQYGLPMLALIGVAVWSPVAYSVPPLKLGYRPFNELLVVLPALVGVVVGTDMVLSGGWSWLAIGVGWVHALFCISWFVVSRVPDYEPDRRVGKITSVVYVGRDNAALLSAGYLALALAAVPLLLYVYSPIFAVSALAYGWLMLGCAKLDPYDATNASWVRLRNMHTTTAHALVLGAGLLVTGV